MLSKRSWISPSVSVLRSFSAATSSTGKNSKVYPSSIAALEGLQDGMTMIFSGFGMCGIPENLIAAVRDRQVQNLNVISNDCGTHDFGLGILLASKQITKLTASYLGENRSIPKYLREGALELHLCPQGTLAEKLRSGGAGIPAFFTPAGYGTFAQTGNYPIKYKADGSGEVEMYSQPKEIRYFHDRPYLLEESLTGDYACIKGWKADKAGNVIFKSTARNFNPDCAKAAKIAIVEVEEIVEIGELKPDEIHLPGIYIDRVVKGEKFEKRIEKLRFSKPAASSSTQQEVIKYTDIPIRDRIAMRAAQEFKSGMYVNLGIGVPTIAGNYIPKDVQVTLQSENGLLGIGPYPQPGQHDADLVNAGKETISYAPGASIFCSSDSFAMIRGGHIDLTVLGALEVSAKGDIASWIIPGKVVKGMGGAMDLVSGCKTIIVSLQHTDKFGKSKIKQECDLPLTGKACASLIVTELAVFAVDRVHGTGLTLIEIAPGVSVEEVRAKTDATFAVADNLKLISIC